MLTSQEKPVLSVSELNQYARGVLEMHVGRIKVTGEISNLSRPASGHWYFTLKDDNAQVRCAMFRNRNMLIRSRIDNGMQVVVHGAVSLYEGRGDYQLIADFIEEAGLGALQRRFEMLKQQLAAEGLFAAVRKKPIPKQVKHLAVITSPTGAVIHDVIQVLKKRYPLLPITLIPASVQGEQAINDLCQALARAERWNSENPDNAFDAIIFGRGGGSLEDLWAFNEEKVARAIAACSIPIISAVGHETDTTIADFVADLRAPTPSAAAEMISPDLQTVYQQLDHIEARLTHRIERMVQQQKALLHSLSLGLKHPSDTLKQWQKQFEQLRRQLHISAKQQLTARQHRVQLLAEKLHGHSPQTRLDSAQQRLNFAQSALQQRMQSKLDKAKERLRLQSQLLDMVSPLATLQRGYSITKTEQGDIVRNAGQLKTGYMLETRVESGIIISQIKAIKES